ncbi:MAG: DUF2379 family protein [Hyalangium sp.]|uniref:DUF2379 family protein n=1 Tax=Hyalangium sp. TaxID=2028555 RepID=UPI00389AB76C
MQSARASSPSHGGARVSRSVDCGRYGLPQAAGDLDGARQQMRGLLAVEVVPMYRQAAEENLVGLDERPLA